MRIPLSLLLLAACGSDPGGGATVGAAGGTVASPDGNAQLVIPAGALAQDTGISIAAGTNAAAIPGTAYTFSPDGTEFQLHIRLTLGYDPAMLPAGTDPTSLRIFSVGTGGTPVQMPDQTVDTGAHTVTATMQHFSQAYLGRVACAPATLPNQACYPLISVAWGGTPTTATITTPAAAGFHVLRAHVGACPPGATNCITPHVGCHDEDFSATPPPETQQNCLTGGSPPSCAASPASGVVTDYLFSGVGFYCYRVVGSNGEWRYSKDDTVELYSFTPSTSCVNAGGTCEIDGDCCQGYFCDAAFGHNGVKACGI